MEPLSTEDKRRALQRLIDIANRNLSHENREIRDMSLFAEDKARKELDNLGVR